MAKEVSWLRFSLQLSRLINAVLVIVFERMNKAINAAMKIDPHICKDKPKGVIVGFQSLTGGDNPRASERAACQIEIDCLKAKLGKLSCGNLREDIIKNGIEYIDGYRKRYN